MFGRYVDITFILLSACQSCLVTVILQYSRTVLSYMVSQFAWIWRCATRQHPSCDSASYSRSHCRGRASITSGRKHRFYAGMNIDSLAVGLNVDTALFTITVTCTGSMAADMLAKVSELPKVGSTVKRCRSGNEYLPNHLILTVPNLT
jgi:hypothetical protein